MVAGRSFCEPKQRALNNSHSITAIKKELDGRRMRRPVRLRMAGDTHGVSERREAKRRSSRSDRSERMAWRWIGYAMEDGYAHEGCR